MPTAPLVQRPNPFLAEYERLSQSRPPKSPEWLGRVRDEAMQRLSRSGFPTSKTEEWKYTDVAPIVRASFRSPPEESGWVGVERVREVALGGPATCRLVFVDGRHEPGLSSQDHLPPGVRVASLAAALSADGAAVEPLLGDLPRAGADAFVLLNAALARDGALVQVGPDTDVRDPIEFVFLSSGGPNPTANHLRNVVLLGAGAKATVVETYAGPDGSPYFTNGVTDLVVGENAAAEHCKLQREGDRAFHVARLRVRQSGHSHAASHVASFGGGLVRNEVAARFEGEGAECLLNGIYVVGGRQHVDNHTSIDHDVPHCTSREVYKGVLDGEARGVFYGRVVVRPDAQKTDASQTNKNLVLSEHALVNSTPALEINADDVKCSHASATGQLDRDAVFYLRSRGLEDSTARSILTYAFVHDVVRRIPLEAARAVVDGLVLERLPNGTAVREAL